MANPNLKDFFFMGYNSRDQKLLDEATRQGAADHLAWLELDAQQEREIAQAEAALDRADEEEIAVDAAGEPAGEEQRTQFSPDRIDDIPFDDRAEDRESASRS